MGERIREIQKYLNDVRHNIAVLLNGSFNDYQTMALENSSRLLNMIDERLDELKNYSVEPPSTLE